MNFNFCRIKKSAFRSLSAYGDSSVLSVFLAVKSQIKPCLQRVEEYKESGLIVRRFGKVIMERVLIMRNLKIGQSLSRAEFSVCKGFTLAEILLIVVILAIAAMMAIPFASSGTSTQLKSAAIIISSDLEYAKSMAISRGKQYSVVFNTGAESYQIEDANGVISHPVRKGSTYTVNFAADSRLSRVDISSVTFDASNTTIGFNYLGSPQADGSYLNSEGEIVLSAGGSTMTVNVEPVTGYITISN